ncbi:MAG: site-specific integrase, partial [Gammaproteobacteria bacterium]
MERFSTSLWLERGLAENTRRAYASDLARLAVWLNGRSTKLLAVHTEDLWGFLSAETAAGASART